MKSKLTILLIEDDPAACKAIAKYTDELSDISLIGVTNNSGKAIEYVKDFFPHAIILDLELHQGGGNGLVFLQELKKLDPDYSPYILVTTNNTSGITYEYSRNLGADFIMSKHQSDYSAQNVIEFLRMIKDLIIERSSQSKPDYNVTESLVQKNQRMKRKISLELDNIGISPKVIGYQYLIDAIQIIINKPENNLCAIIGKKYKKTDSSVERAMQNAINKAWRSSDIDDLTKYYTAKISSDRGVPTITEFVFYYANKLKHDY